MPGLLSPLTDRRLVVVLLVLVGLVALPACTSRSSPAEGESSAVDAEAEEDVELDEVEKAEEVEEPPAEPASPFDFVSSSVLSDEDGYSYKLDIEAVFSSQIDKDVTHEKPGFATALVALERGVGTLENLTPERAANPVFVVSPFQLSAVYPASSPVCGLDAARDKILRIDGEPCFIEIATAAAVFDDRSHPLGVGEVKNVEVGVMGQMMSDYKEGVLGDNVVRFRGIPEAEWETYVEAIQNPEYVMLALGVAGEIVSPVMCERVIKRQAWPGANDPRILASTGPLPVCE